MPASAIGSSFCRDGKPSAVYNPNDTRWPFDDFQRADLHNYGAWECFVEHEEHHINQIECLCGDVCKDCPDGRIQYSAEFQPTMECYAHIRQLECLIRKACALRRRQLRSPSEANDPQLRDSIDFLIYMVDNYGGTTSNFCGRNVQSSGDIRNAHNYEELRQGRNCTQKGGVE